jgi:phosphonate transport system substrate-binding protein
MHNIKRLLFPGLPALLLLFSVSTSFAQQNYIMGVHPYKKPAVLAEMFKPLIAYLEKEIGATISFRSSKNYAAHMERIRNGDYDIFYMGPSLYAMISDSHPDKVRIAATVVNKGSPTFKGVVVAREDSPIASLADLKGKKVAFGDRSSTLSCYVPASMLMDAGVFDTLEYKFVGSHDNVAKGVLKGFFDAGGLKPGVAKSYVGKGLKIIAESEPVYEHVVGVSASLDGETVEKIKAALANVQNPEVYTSIKSSLTGFEITKSSDYDNIRKIMKEVDAKIPL